MCKQYHCFLHFVYQYAIYFKLKIISNFFFYSFQSVDLGHPDLQTGGVSGETMSIDSSLQQVGGGCALFLTQFSSSLYWSKVLVGGKMASLIMFWVHLFHLHWKWAFVDLWNFVWRNAVVLHLHLIESYLPLNFNLGFLLYLTFFFLFIFFSTPYLISFLSCFLVFVTDTCYYGYWCPSCSFFFVKFRASTKVLALSLNFV